MENVTQLFSIAYVTLVNLLPYVIAGVLLSEWLKGFEWTQILINRHSQSPVQNTLLATLIGFVSPLCTYGSIPIVLNMYRLGFPVQPLITFLIASSLMSPQLFLLTWGGISPVMAIWRLGLGFLFCIFFGLVLLKIKPGWMLNPNFSKEKDSQNSAKARETWRTFLSNSFESLQFIGFYLVLGILIGAAIEVFVPVEWFFLVFQSQEWIGILVGAVMGVPLYVCGGGTIPLIQSMLNTGMSTGAALAFFLVGPATRVTPLMALATLIRPKFILFFVLVLLIFSVLSGLIYEVTGVGPR